MNTYFDIPAPQKKKEEKKKIWDCETYAFDDDTDNYSVASSTPFDEEDKALNNIGYPGKKKEGNGKS